MDPLKELRRKITDREGAARWAAGLRAAGQKTVFTNGCFDLLHYGHVHYLAEARGLGDALIVGINSQDSVQRLKGSHRPIQEEQSRVYQIASLFFVDMVVVFDEDTPLALIQAITPDVLVKGGDWPIADIVGADWVTENGGEVRCLPFQAGFSTTLLEEKIKSL
jgi:D-glycero-beta-D-manno-heptose 1-phosphate adenylyltransferase